MICKPGDLTGELALRERDGVRAFHENSLGRMRCRHARRSGGGKGLLQEASVLPAMPGVRRQLVVPLCRKYYAFSDTNMPDTSSKAVTPNESAKKERVETPVLPVPGKEQNERPAPDPTRYGDWEKNGRCIDF